VGSRVALIAGLVVTLLSAPVATPAAQAQLLPPVDPLTPGGDHTSEDHAYHDHTREVLYDEASGTPITLTGARFERAGLSGADLRFVQAGGASFDRALLSAADLSDGVLTGASLRETLAGCLPDPDPGAVDPPPLCTRFDRADLAAAELVAADLRGASLLSASLVGADLGRASLARADLTRADFASARLDSADLSQSELAGASFAGAVLDWATLYEAATPCTSDAPAVCASFSGARLRRANLRRGVFDGVAFVGGADLSWASLDEGSYASADFAGAELQGAILDGADFFGASFANASLRSVRASCLPPPEVTADGTEAAPSCARFDSASFDSADLTGAWLRGASLREARLPGADFASDLGAGSCPSSQPVDLRGADLAAADLSEAIHFDVGCILVDATTNHDPRTRFPPGFDPVAAGLPEPSSTLAQAAALLALSGLIRRARRA